MTVGDAANKKVDKIAFALIPDRNIVHCLRAWGASFAAPSPRSLNNAD